MSKSIFIDCHVFDGNFQGTTTYIKGLYTELIKQSDIQFFFASSNISQLQKIFGEQKNVKYLQYKSHNKFLRLLVDIPQFIKTNKIYYAHFQYVAPPIKYCKYIVTTHDVLFLDYPQYFPLLYRIKNKILFGMSAKRADIVLTVSEFSKNQLKRHFGLNKVYVTPNAVENIFFEEYNKSEIIQKVSSKYNIKDYWIYISRKEPRKNHDTLLKVFVENEFYKKYHIVFVGSKAIRNKLYDEFYNQLPDEVKQKIISLDHVLFEDLLLLLRGASLSIYPSVAEGFGIPPLEAVAAGIKSICSNTTAMADFDFMKENLFNPFDKNELKQLLNKVVQDEVDINLKNKLEVKYNWNTSSQIFLKALQDNNCI
jgi:glycosyltransferase involved in cell wall biosynthesis